MRYFKIWFLKFFLIALILGCFLFLPKNLISQSPPDDPISETADETNEGNITTEFDPEEIPEQIIIDTETSTENVTEEETVTEDEDVLAEDIEEDIDIATEDTEEDNVTEDEDVLAEDAEEDTDIATEDAEEETVTEDEDVLAEEAEEDTDIATEDTEEDTVTEDEDVLAEEAEEDTDIATEDTEEETVTEDEDVLAEEAEEDTDIATEDTEEDTVTEDEDVLAEEIEEDIDIATEEDDETLDEQQLSSDEEELQADEDLQDDPISDEEDFDAFLEETADDDEEPPVNTVSEEDNIGQELLELAGEGEETEETQPGLPGAAVEAEEVGLSASFIRLPFEETREQRRQRLQQDAYFDELVHISQTGVHQYEVKPSPLRGSGSINMGVFPPPSIVSNNLRYEDIYDENPVLMLFANYEWNLFKNIGDLSIHLELGTLWDAGNGRFAPGSINEEKYNSQNAKEAYFFVMVPVSLGAMYSFEFFNKQFFIPFGIGGVSYFGLLEIRDDFDFGSIGVAGTPSIFFGGGVQLLLDGLAPGGATVIDREFGINHIYLIGEVRQYIGLYGDFQLEGLVASGGIRFDF